MVSFRKSLMVVALLALCAGLASAQMVIDTTGTNFTAALVRNEGVTEAMPPISFSVTSNSALATYDVTVISSAPITSVKADLQFNGVAASTIAGNLATFSAVTFAADITNFSLEGLRIDATQLPSLSSGQTTGLGENLIIIMSSRDGAPFTTPFGGTSPITTITGIGYAVKSLTVGTADSNMAPAPDGKSSPYSQCQATPYDPTTAGEYTPAYTVSLAEGFGTAWQNMGGEGTDATQGTQFSLAFTNVPSNTTLYVPGTYDNGSGLTLTLVSPSKPTPDENGNVAVPASGIVVYEVTGATSAPDTAYIPVFVSYNSGEVPALTASAAPITVTGMYAPQSTNGGVSGKDDLIPRFLGTAQSSHAVGFMIAACTSTIMFPYITNDMGYDTGLAISNTGNLLASGGQSGTCQWSFYGNNAPTTAVPATAAISAGTTNAALLSAMAPGFTGFAVASCNFQGAYGYAFIVGNLGGTDVAQGYLGLLSGQTGDFGFYPPPVK